MERLSSQAPETAQAGIPPGLHFFSTHEHGLFPYAQSVALALNSPFWPIQLNSSAMTSPMAGLLPLLRREVHRQRLDVDTLAHSVTQYIPIQQALSNWLDGRVVVRDELAILEDLSFEQGLMFQALTALMDEVFEDNAVIAIEGGEHLSHSSLLWLRSLSEFPLKKTLWLMVGMDASASFSTRQEDEVWDNFHDWVDDNFTLQAPPANCSALRKRRLEYFSDIEPELVMQNLQLMAWPEAELAARQCLSEPERWNKRQLLTLHLNLSEALVNQGDCEQALNQLKLVQETDLLEHYPQQLCMVQLLSSLCYVRLQSFERALESADFAYQIAARNSHQRNRVQALFISFFAHDKSCTPIALDDFRSLVTQLRQQDMPCSLLYCLRNFYSYLRFYDDLTGREARSVTDQALRLARTIGHTQGIAACYHSKGIICSYFNDYRNTLRCFAVSSKIREKLGDDMECVRIYNGSGYFNTLTENYQTAFTQYKLAFSKARELSEHSELLVTLYNFAWLFYCARDYQRACDILNNLVKICRIRRLTHFPFRNLHDVLTLKGMCHVRLHELSSAKHCLDKIDGLPFGPSKTGEFMGSMLRGSLFAEQGHLQQALQCFEGTPQLLGSVIDLDSRLVPQCYMEQLLVLSQLSEWDAAQQLLANCHEICATFQLKQLGVAFTYVQQKIDACEAVYSDELPVPVELPTVDLGMKSLVEAARLSAKLTAANQRLREFRLISQLHDLAARIRVPKQLAESALKLICDNFNLQRASILRYRGEEYIPWCHYGHNQETVELAPYLARYHANEQGRLLEQVPLSVKSGLRARYNAVFCLSLYDNEQGRAVLCLTNTNGSRYFDQQDEEILMLLAQQLGTQLLQARHQRQLLKMSSTDGLTGLLNRSAMHGHMAQMLEDQQRFSVAYVDLDNFKEINDRLGHDAGDKVLQWFATLLQDSLRELDIAARWGGDEFVIAFKNTTQQQAQSVVERILERLAERGYFVPELVVVTHMSSERIPRLGCSVGIAESDEHSDSASVLLKQADAALYHAKAAGKGCVFIA